MHKPTKMRRHLFDLRRAAYLPFSLWVCIVIFIASGCSSGSLDKDDGSETGGSSITAGGTTSFGQLSNALDYTVGIDESEDSDYSEKQESVPTDENNEFYEDFVENSTFNSSVTITYSGTSAKYTTLPDGVTAVVEGGNVTITSKTAGVEYILTGSASEGCFKIYSTKKYKLTLNNLSLASSSYAAINSQSSKRAFICVSGTNTLSSNCSANTGEEDMKGCIFSEGKLLFSGSGTLSITEKSKHGIASDDYVYVHNGPSITINAEKDGIHANDLVRIAGGTLKITAASDGIECEEGGIDILSGKITVNSADDAVTASYDDDDATIVPYINVSGGLLKITTTGEKGAGLKSSGRISVTDGIMQASLSGAAGKGLSSDGNMTISGGKITVITSGGTVLEYANNTVTDVSGAAGIKCDSTLSISGGTLNLKSTGQGGKGISCDMDVNIAGGTVQIITTGQKYTYSNSIDTSPKGIKADGNLTISNGAVSVTTTGGEGSEAIESKKVMTISGGTVEAYAYDDAINAASAINISGGNIYAYSTNNDAIDSNGNMSISGGVVVASGTSAPEGAFDCDQNTFAITGGVLIGTGGETSSISEGSSSSCSVIYNGSGSSGALVTVVASDGTHILSTYIPRAYTQMSLAFSSPLIKKGTAYKIYSGGALSGGSDFHNLITGGTFSASSATLVTSFTPSSYVTTIGTSSGGGGGNQPGGRP